MKALIHQLAGAWRARPLASKMASFAAIGLGNTFIDLGVFTLAYKVAHLPLVSSNVLAWLVAVSGSYVLNTMITFRAQSGSVLRRKDYLSFVAFGVLGVTATTATLVFLSNYISVPAAKMVSILAGFIVNFTMSHFVVFRPKPPSNPPLRR